VARSRSPGDREGGKVMEIGKDWFFVLLLVLVSAAEK
jgi:hypothetical protein